MPISDPRAIEYSNSVIRPLAERFRNLKSEVDQAINRWFVDQSALFTNDSSVVQDRADSPSHSQITGADVNNVINQLIQFQTQLNQAGVKEVIEKPCVQPLRAR